MYETEKLKDDFVAFEKSIRDKGFRRGLWTGVAIAAAATTAIEVAWRLFA